MPYMPGPGGGPGGGADGGLDELEWVSANILSIFQAATWSAPIAKFIDEHCVIFEDVEENKLEYTPIHNAFKRMVDDLLAAHLQELQVTTEQFTRFCQYGLTGNNELHRSIVEMMLSVDDFLVFKAVMVKRNAELYREALGRFAMEHPPAAAPPPPPPVVPGEPAAVAAVEPVAPTFDEAALKAAEDEADRLDAERRCMEAELQLAIALSLQLERKLQLIEELNEILNILARMNAQAEQAALENAGDEALRQHPSEQAAFEQQLLGGEGLPPPPHPQAAELPPPRLVPREALPATIRVQPLADAGGAAPPLAPPEPVISDLERQALGRSRAEACRRGREQDSLRDTPSSVATAPAPPQRQQPTEAERKARAEHLKRQRELLLEKKNKEREGQLSAYNQTRGPTAAGRAAERACASAGLAAVGGEQPHPGSPTNDAGRRLAAELSGQVSEAPPAHLPDPAAAAAEMRRALTRQLKQTLTQAM